MPNCNINNLILLLGDSFIWRIDESQVSDSVSTKKSIFLCIPIVDSLKDDYASVFTLEAELDETSSMEGHILAVLKVLQRILQPTLYPIRFLLLQMQVYFHF